MKCSQFTTAVSLCLRRTKFTTMRNFSLARVFSFLSSPSPSPTVLLSLVWTVSLSFFSRFSSAFSLDATRCKVSPLYSKLGFKPGSTSSCISTLSVFNSFILEHRIQNILELRCPNSYSLSFSSWVCYFFFFLFILNDNREFFFFIFSPLLVFIFLFFYYKLYKSIIFFLHFSVFLSVKLNIIELSKL